MGKIFRSAFLVLDALQVQSDYLSYFPANYKPVQFDIPLDQDLTKMHHTISARPEHETCKLMESLYYFHCHNPRLPRSVFTNSIFAYRYQTRFVFKIKMFDPKS